MLVSHLDNEIYNPRRGFWIIFYLTTSFYLNNFGHDLRISVCRRICNCQLVLLFHAEFVYICIFHLPNFYPSDSFFIANKLMDFVQPPYWFSFQFQKSTKAKCTCFLKICHLQFFSCFSQFPTFTIMLLLITRNEEVQGWAANEDIISGNSGDCSVVKMGSRTEACTDNLVIP